MCISAFVEPEIAAWTMMAFSKLSMVTISDGFKPILASFTACFPAFFAYWIRSGLVAGRSALPGRASPRASAMICMVDAVPMNEQAPQLGHALCLAHVSFASSISPRSY